LKTKPGIYLFSSPGVIIQDSLDLLIVHFFLSHNALDHINWNSFYDNHFNSCICSFHNCISCKAGGTKMIVVSAPACSTASLYSVKTGRSKCVVPPFPGLHHQQRLTVLNHLRSMESSFTSCKILEQLFWNLY
jgi:hypothetical protein